MTCAGISGLRLTVRCHSRRAACPEHGTPRCPSSARVTTSNTKENMARVQLAHPFDENKPVLDVALSERNLIVLLSKLYTPGSPCSFVSGDVPEDFAYAILRSEPDNYHYASPTRDGAPPGPMHPVAELVRAAVSQVLGAELWADEAPGRQN